MNRTRPVVQVVDDHPENVALVATNLELEGYVVETAANGAEGVQKAVATNPDAILLDIMMPVMDGFEACRELRRNPQTKHIPIIMLTAKTGVDDIAQGLECGANDYIKKPFHIVELLTRVRAALRLKSAQDELLELNRTLEQRVDERTRELGESHEELRKLNEGLEERVAKRTASILALYKFVAALNGLDSVEQVADRVVATAAELFLSRRVSLMMPDSAGGGLTIVSAVGIPEDVVEQTRVPIGSSIAGRVFAESRSIVVNDPNELGAEPYDSILFASVPLMSASLSTRDGPVGVLNVTERFDLTRFDEQSLAELQTVAEAAATAIQSQLRLRERNEARDAIILALAGLAEHRDPETGAHLQRVQHYCRVLSEALAQTPRYASVIDSAFIETIVRSSPLHDIGKVGIPDHILLKPARLTAEEFEVMRRHSAIGGDTIRALVEQGRTQSFLQMGMEIAYCHHEKFDGSGYPYGLAGEDIPLPARIMSVADGYDALTSKRVYKQPMTHEEAAAIIRADSGSHFDPAVVEAFSQRETEFKRLAAELADSAEAKEGDARAGAEQRSMDLVAATSGGGDLKTVGQAW